MGQELSKKLREPRIDDSLRSFLRSYSVPVADSAVSALISHLEELLVPRPALTGTPMLHLLSAEEKVRVSTMVQTVSSFDPEALTRALDEINSLLGQIHSLRGRLDCSLDNECLEGIIKQLRTHHQSNEDDARRRAELCQNLQALEADLAQAEAQLKIVEAELESSMKDEAAFILSRKVRSAAVRFVDAQMELKLKEVQRYFVEMMTAMARKPGLAETPDAWCELLPTAAYNGHDGISSGHLSAGEKQLYVLSLVWAMIRASRKEIPLVLDTLLARLDREHRLAVFEHFLPRASSQTIVFSTDAEINSEDRRRLETYIARDYLMEFDETENLVRIRPGYFECVPDGRRRDSWHSPLVL
jgi:DNA sulfur modification protein DndD